MNAIYPTQLDSPFLAGAIDSLRRRGRSLKHRNVIISVERVIELVDGRSCERLQIDCKRRQQSFRIMLWEDRSIWIHACESIKNAGWKFQFTDSGRLIGSKGGQELIRALEETISVMPQIDGNISVRLASIWDILIAKGPKAV